MKVIIDDEVMGRLGVSCRRTNEDRIETMLWLVSLVDSLVRLPIP